MRLARFSAYVSFVALLALPYVANGQPRFAVEVEGGRNAGLTPYLTNVVYSEEQILGQEFIGEEPFRPFLVDERTGWGTNVAIRLVSNQLQAGLRLRWFDVGTARVHHRGEVSGGGELRPTRVRPDGTVDDSGTSYTELDEPVDITIGPARRANLFVFGLEGGYRFYLIRGDVDLFAPVSGSVLVTHLSRAQAPYRFGLGAQGGIAASFDFVSVISIVVSSKLHGVITPSYWHRSDAARRAADLGRSTESALFSATSFVSFDLALQFAIR
jgi:hypothetical protein